MNRIVVIVLLTIGCFSALFAEEYRVHLPNNTEAVQVNDFGYLKDPEGIIEPDAILSLPDEFQPAIPDSLVRYPGEMVYWIHFDLENASDKDQSWVLSFGEWSFIDFYIQEEGKINHKRSGVFLPFNDRSYHEVVSCGILVDLRPGQIASCWVRLDDRGNLDEPSGGIVGFQAIPKEVAEGDEANMRSIIYLFVGVYLVMFLFNLFLGFSTKERAYIYYLGFMISYLAIFLANSGYLFSIFSFVDFLAPARIWVLHPVVVILNVSQLLFVHSFLDLKKRYKGWHRIFQWAIGVILAALVLKLVYFELGLILTNLMSLIVLVLVLIVGIKATKDRLSGAIYLLIAQIFVVISSLTILLASAGVLPLNNFTVSYAMPLGASIEMILFSLALGNKINTLRVENKEKQDRIIQQLEENTALQTKVNRELEEKVEERTREIMKQKELVEATQVALDREKSERAIQQAILEKEKAEASEKMKKQFFAQMTHEFRTPLTLIMGPLEEISHESLDGRVKRKASMALRNTRILLRLVNQLLGLSRLEEGREELHPQRRDIVRFVSQRGAAFESLWERKKLDFEIRKDNTEIEMDFDPDLMEKILNNLLSNAIKFTSEGGKISLRIGMMPDSRDQVRISIKDSGIGISEEKLPFIFDRFYRADGEKTTELEGTGLGLPLVQELVDLHRGEIKVSSLEGLGTEFTVIFPQYQEGEKWETQPIRTDNLAQQLEQEAIPIPNTASDEWDLDENRENLLLLIEDNADVREYVRMSLEPMYKVIEAVNGLDGIEQAIEQVPDLIISDVMMPGANGFQVCEAIKKDEKTSHIPIIMLTARAALDDKIEGLETGADAYLGKPFNAKELRVQIKNLIDNRLNLRERYRKEMITTPSVTEATSVEEQFLIRLKELMQEELSNEKLSVEDMAGRLAMSRTQLHRKIKALTGQSTGEFIRNFRLEYAYQLLEQNAGTVSEVAFQVGFSSASYFSKTFSAKYGISPKEVKK